VKVEVELDTVLVEESTQEHIKKLEQKIVTLERRAKRLKKERDEANRMIREGLRFTRNFEDFVESWGWEKR
jgi:chromosome segregation ATPase